MKSFIPATPYVAESLGDDGLLSIHQGKVAILVTHEQARALATELLEAIK